MALVAACFALGIVVAHLGSVQAFGIQLFFGLASVLLLFGLIALRAGWLNFSFLAALLAFVSAGTAAALLFEVRFPPNHVNRLAELGVDLEDALRLEGRLVSTLQRTPYGLQFDVDARRAESRGQVHEVTGKVRLRVLVPEDQEVARLADSLRLEYGDSIRTLARLRKPRLYQNPGSFDFRRWMESIEDLCWVGTIKSPLLVEKIPKSDAPMLAEWLARTRQRLLLGIDRLYPLWSAEGRHGAVLKAVLLGDRSSLDSDTIENFRRTGLYHLLVISGLHVGLLALLAGVLLRHLRLREAWQTAFLMLFLLVYAGLVEQRAPTLRATLMIAVYLLARFLYRERAALNAIGVACLILLLLRPPWLFESGFQLSFTAVLLIAGLAVPLLERTTEPYRRALAQLESSDRDPTLAPRLAQFRLDLRALIARLRALFPFFGRHPATAAATVAGPVRVTLWIANMLLFSSVLQLGLLLPMAETFHRVAYAGIALNAVAIPIMTLLLGFAVPVVILGATLPLIAVWPAKVLGLVVSGLLVLTDLPRLPDWLSFRVPEPPLWVVWGFALSVIIAAAALGRRQRAFWASLAVTGIFAALISIHPFDPRVPSGMLEVTALDCGGGDALFLVLPDQATMLIDGCGGRGQSAGEGAYRGRRWDPGEDIISPYLWSRGVKKVDILVLTHAHDDHLGGLHAVVRYFRIGEFWHGRNPPTAGYQALLEQIRRRGTVEREVVAGAQSERGQAFIQVLWPPPSRPVPGFPSNDESVVLRITHGRMSVLFPGDITEVVERELLNAGVPLESQVLKVAHHGAKSSSSAAFLARVRPWVVIVTTSGSGLANLPNPETLERFRAIGAQVFQTALDGAVKIELKESGLAVRIHRVSPAAWAAGDRVGSSPGRLADKLR